MTTASAAAPRCYSWNPDGQTALAPYAVMAAISSEVRRERRTPGSVVRLKLPAVSFWTRTTLSQCPGRYGMADVLAFTSPFVHAVAGRSLCVAAPTTLGTSAHS